MQQYDNKSYVGMANCYFCNEVKHLLFDRRLKESLPQYAIYDKQPCDKCMGYMDKGIIIISVRDGEQGDNPYRTGGWWVVKEDAVKRLIKDNEPLLKDILSKRMLFMEDSITDRIGLQKANQKGDSS